ncbi:hypothetical protein B0H34DRAFT_678083 [Crassisporium funariophilum]|nr:hypothetical protein B0H34DRAFT_678083 [Crassisporium funariophilum]
MYIPPLPILLSLLSLCVVNNVMGVGALPIPDVYSAQALSARGPYNIADLNALLLTMGQKAAVAPAPAVGARMVGFYERDDDAAAAADAAVAVEAVDAITPAAAEAAPAAPAPAPAPAAPAAAPPVKTGTGHHHHYTILSLNTWLAKFMHPHAKSIKHEAAAAAAPEIAARSETDSRDADAAEGECGEWLCHYYKLLNLVSSVSIKDSGSRQGVMMS